METIINEILNETNRGDHVEPDLLQKIRIAVIGVGGAGSNAVTRLYNNGIKSAKTYAINTDAKHLNEIARAHEKILIGKEITRGMGAGGDPLVAKKCIESDLDLIRKVVENNEIVFVSAGMGGGTGTGAAPIVARTAKEEGALVISVVTLPFKLEGVRIKKAHEGLKEMMKYSDTVIVIDNNRLLDYAPNLPINDAFKLADNIIGRAVKGIADSIVLPSLINIDYADVRSIMKDKGLAMISVGEGSGPDKIQQAIESTLTHPLLDVNFEGAKGGIIHIEGSESTTLGEVVELGKGITNQFDKDADVKIGARINPNLTDRIIVSAIITGVHSPQLVSSKKPDNEYIVI